MPRVYVSIGTNQRREASLRKALAALRARHGTLELSPVYEAQPVGFIGAPFLNLVARFETGEALDVLRDGLRGIETACGRVRRGKRFGPRPMDIDVLIYGDLLDEAGSDVPRAEMLEQAYVLRPLSDLDPTARHPRLRETFAELRERLALDESGLSPWAGSIDEGDAA